MHSIDHALNANKLAPAFMQALEKAWCVETCWPQIRDSYSAQNPSYGNCLVSVLAAWADRGFKDTIMPGLALYLGQQTWHFRLMDLNTPIDPTWQQFKQGTYFQAVPSGLPVHHRIIEGSLFNAAENTDLRQRLNMLLSRMKDHGYEAPCTADEIADRAEQSFAYLRQSLPRNGLSS